MSPVLDSIGSVKAYGWGAFTQVKGSFESIQTINADGQSQVAFTSIPQTYTHLQMRCHVRSTMNYTDYNIASIVFRINGASIRGELYSFHSVTADNNSSPTAYGSISAQEAYALSVPTANIDANVFGVGVIDILDYRNTSKFKTFNVLSGTNDNTSYKIRRAQLSSMLYQGTDAINSIYLSTDYNFTWAYGTKFSLYGIKTEVE